MNWMYGRGLHLSVSKLGSSADSLKRNADEEVERHGRDGGSIDILWC